MSRLKIAVNIEVHASFDLELLSFLDVWPGVGLLGGFPGSSAGKESSCNAEDSGSIPESGRSFGGGHGNPLQYSCLENPHGQRSLVRCIVHGLQRVGHD